MSTPVWDFVRRYAEEDPLRLHMPGHKGVPGLGPEPWDLTEIPGADSLYEASGILRESEEEAGRLYGCPTFYSAEGSSLAVRAMVFLACRWALDRGKRPKIAAARNVHRTFVTAAAKPSALRLLREGSLSYWTTAQRVQGERCSRAYAITSRQSVEETPFPRLSCAVIMPLNS